MKEVIVNSLLCMLLLSDYLFLLASKNRLPVVADTASFSTAVPNCRIGNGVTAQPPTEKLALGYLTRAHLQQCGHSILDARISRHCSRLLNQPSCSRTGKQLPLGAQLLAVRPHNSEFCLPKRTHFTLIHFFPVQQASLAIMPF